MKRLLSLCIFLSASGLALLAQDVRASLSGIVTDPTGATVPGVQVRVTSVERGTTTEAVSNESGFYLVQFLLPGRYQLSADKAGFKRMVKSDINLAAADHPALDLRMEIGQTSDSVTVTGDLSLLQTETSTRSATIETKAIEDIPTAGRNLYQFQYTLPGVIKNSRYWGSMELYAFGNINGVSIGGGRSGENETLIDGVSNTKLDRGVAYAPALNGTQEVTVQTNSYDAQFGRIGGGVTLITTKSGTNDLHGQLFEFFKNDKLNSADWIANAQGDGRNPMRNNTYGFEVDGPVILPKLFDGRNKAFFMLSLEGLREHNTSGEIRTVPTAAERGGDFSKTLNGDGDLVTIYDPTTTRLDTNGKYVRTPFAGNIIPGNRMSVIAKNVTSYIPLPTSNGTDAAHSDNYGSFTPDMNGYNSWLGRMDLKLTQKSSIAFRYGETPWINHAGRVWGTNAAEPSTEWPSTRVSRNWGAEWTYTLSPTMVLSVRGGLARYEGFGGNTYAEDFDPRKLGFSDALVAQFTTIQFPRFNFSNSTEVGANTVKSYEASDTWSITPTMNWVRGRHIIKYGGDIRRYNRNQLQPGLASGRYDFNQSWTQANPTQGDDLSGNDFATFLLGYPTGGYVDRNIDPAYRSQYYGLFIQDDFKLTPKFTLNIGLRWDYEAPIQERFNRMIRTFDTTAASPIASKVAGLNIKGGLVYAGVNGVSAQAFQPKRNNFQPRVGFAWNVLPKWVIRGGYGLSMLGQSSWGPATGFSRQTPLVSSTDGNLTPAASLSDPFPSTIYPGGLLQPIGSSEGLATNLGQAVTGQYTNRPLPYSHQFSIGFQRELPFNMVTDVSYVGNLTNRLPVSLNQNFIPASELAKIPVDQRAAYFTAKVDNPMAGLLPNSGLNGATIPRAQLLYAYPQFSQVTITDVPIGKQNYHSLQSRLTRRFSKGFMMQAAYTWSKTLEQVSVLDQTNTNTSDLLSTKLEKRLTQYDIPHKFTIQAIYELPFGKGKPVLGHSNALVNGIVGGWNLSAQYAIQSGFIMDFPNAANLAPRSAKLTNDQRTELAKANGRSYWDPSYDKWFDVTLFPKKAQAAYTVRDFPTRFSDVRAQGVKSAEISVYKQFLIKERVKWQIRADAYNAFNHPWFGQPQSVDVTNSRFGQLKADMNNETRIISLVMKIIF